MASIMSKSAAKSDDQTTLLRVQEASTQSLLVKWRAKRGGKTYSPFFDLGPHDVIAVVRQGVPARLLDDLVHDMKVSRSVLLSWIDIPEATVKRKIRDDAVLGKAAGEQALGVARLIGQVEGMVSQSGNPQGFDAAAWLADWLTQPNPALGGACPGQYLDTAEGRALVSDILQRMQSGAYA